LFSIAEDEGNAAIDISDVYHRTWSIIDLDLRRQYTVNDGPQTDTQGGGEEKHNASTCEDEGTFNPAGKAYGMPGPNEGLAVYDDHLRG
jgi:hypothetical protein